MLMNQVFSQNYLFSLKLRSGHTATLNPRRANVWWASSAGTCPLPYRAVLWIRNDLLLIRIQRRVFIEFRIQPILFKHIWK